MRQGIEQGIEQGMRQGMGQGMTWVLIGLLIMGLTQVNAPAASAGPTPTGTWPLRPQPAVVAGFAPPDAPYGAGHRGVDLAGTAGQEVRAALPGTVSFAGRIAGRGVVVVQHGDTRTTYEPVTATHPVGTEVSAGQVLGTLALVGSHCFPRACLHWGWLRASVYLDPLALVGVLRVRLLPLDGRLPLGPRMRLLIGPAQPIGRHMGIELSRRQRSVAQDFLDRAQIRSAFEQVRRRRMA